jgi:hypothetical protein
MFCSRLTVVTESQKARVGLLLREANGATTLGAVCMAIGGDPGNARSCAYSMMARRLINIDLTRKLCDASIVRSLQTQPGVMPALRF